MGTRNVSRRSGQVPSVPKLATVSAIRPQRSVELAAERLEEAARDLDQSRQFAMPGVRSMAEGIHGVLDDLDRLVYADPAACVELKVVRRYVGALGACLARMVVQSCCGEIDDRLYDGGWHEAAK